MTLMEIALAMPIVMIAMGMFVQMFTMGNGLRKGGREGWIASAAAQDLLERVRNEEFADIVRLYNADPFDDPGGPGTAPGATFAVRGLDSVDPAAGTPVGELILPMVNTGTEVVPVWELREDADLPDLAMPRDLSGDAVVDDDDHSDDYTTLPVMVRIRWRGASGPREYELSTIFTEVRY